MKEPPVPWSLYYGMPGQVTCPGCGAVSVFAIPANEGRYVNRRCAQCGESLTMDLERTNKEGEPR